MPPIDKAVLLAAGRGTRMGELTATLPKPMIEVRGKSVLQRIVEGLRDAGVKQFLIVIGYHGSVVRDHFGDGSRFGIEIEYVVQTVQDGTGRVVELAQDFVCEGPFVLSYGDILIETSDYQRLLAAAETADAVITVKHGQDVSKGGAVFVDAEMRLIDLREKPLPGEPTSPWYNAGLYVFRPSIFQFTRNLVRSLRGEYELTDAVRALALSGKEVKALELKGEWADVRDAEVLAQLNRPR